MNLSDNQFSPASREQDFVVSTSLPNQETHFQSTYDWTLYAAKEVLADDEPEEHPEPSHDLLNQEIEEAYQQGYLNGQQAAIVAQDQLEQQKDILAVALDRLKTGDEKVLAKQFWEVLLSLFEQAVGHAKTDPALMRRRCEEAIALINGSVGEPNLHLAPSDAQLLREYDCQIPITLDADLLPGSVRLDHAAGQVFAGSIAIKQEIETRIKAADGGIC